MTFRPGIFMFWMSIAGEMWAFALPPTFQKTRALNALSWFMFVLSPIAFFVSLFLL